MASDSLALNQPQIATGLARTYFFNGRLLSAEDLQREQTLREAGQRRLAQLIGCGIERGLVVTRADASAGSAGSGRLAISAGLGVTPSGEVIEVGDFTLDLAAAASASRAGGFGACAAAFGNGGALAGLHLLVLTPGWIADGRAPTLLGEIGACNRNVELPGVRARLVPLRTPAGADAKLGDLRNRVATALLARAPGAADRMLGWWPTTVAPTLDANDLPLAVLKITTQAAVEWIDVAAARRRLAAPPGNAADALWPQSRRAEMEAFAAQFAAQLLGADDAEQPGASAFPTLPPLLLADAATLARWSAVFGAQGGLALPAAKVLGREGFALALDGALNGAPVARGDAVARLFRLGEPGAAADAGRWLLRLRHRDDPDNASATGTPLPALRNERTSGRIASLAGRALHDPQTPAAERSLAASALTQAPDKHRSPTAGARKRVAKKAAG